MKKLVIPIIAIICCLAIIPFIKCKNEPIIEEDPVQNTIDSLKNINDSLTLEIIFLENEIKDLDYDYFAKRDSIIN